MRLYEKLESYVKSDYYPFHMPGHKRNSRITGADLPYSLDITEIDGFDDLHHAEGILARAEKRAGRLYRADETHYLINGSTVGILSAVMGCTKRGGRILMARNCHKSVYNAVILNELTPIYVFPGFYHGTELCGKISAAEVERILEEEQGIEAVVITSPTYEGVVSDIKSIADVVHKKGIPLIVDEAHGAHFGFHPYFPENANMKGADVVIHSLHKTLPSLTQTALIHMNGDLADRRRIRRYLHILQTSSPSYVLMASVDECIALLEEQREEVFDRYVQMLDAARRNLKRMNNIKLFSTESYDRSKLVFSVKDTFLKNPGGDTKEFRGKAKFTGKMLYDLLLKKYHLQMEMAAGSYVLAMTGPGDVREGMERLIEALGEIDGMLSMEDTSGAIRVSADISASADRNICAHADRNEPEGGISYGFERPEIVMTPYDAECLQEQEETKAGGLIRTARCPWNRAAGKIALEYAYLYPPGIPLIVPGEKIGGKTAEEICRYYDMGFSVEGTVGKGQIEVLLDG